jgi:hypothetical protein
MTRVPPAVFLLASLVLLWAAMWLGAVARERGAHLAESEGKILTVLQGALLTLFGLLMGFTFSMAESRYELRKELVVREANALGTTWLRSATLTEPARSQEQTMLREYVPERVRFLEEGRSAAEVDEALERTEMLQRRLWGVASGYAAEHRDAVTGLYLATLNESIDVAEERTAANENRIPAVVWLMLLFVGCSATFLAGVSVRSQSRIVQAALPVVLAGVLVLTRDLDSPRFGFIRVSQPSMERLASMVASGLPQDAR